VTQQLQLGNAAAATQLGSATGQCHSMNACGSQVSIGSLTKTGGMKKQNNNPPVH